MRGIDRLRQYTCERVLSCFDTLARMHVVSQCPVQTRSRVPVEDVGTETQVETRIQVGSEMGPFELSVAE